MTVHSPKQVIAESQSEADFQAKVIGYATLMGWRHYHTHDSRRSPSGFVDLVLCRPPRLIFAELKSEHGKTSLAQDSWLYDLCRIAQVSVWHGEPAKQDLAVYVWRPSDWDQIAAVLAR